MNQSEIDSANQFIVKELLRKLPPGELIAAAVTARTDFKGLCFYPVVENQAAEILFFLRQKPDEVYIDRRV